jgi:hypothetical protein
MHQIVDNGGLFLAVGLRPLIDHLADGLGPIVAVEALLAKSSGIVAFKAGADDNLFAGALGEEFGVVVRGRGQQCGGEKTDRESHGVLFNVIAQHTDLVVARAGLFADVAARGLIMDVEARRESRLKADCSHEWLPHSELAAFLAFPGRHFFVLHLIGLRALLIAKRAAGGGAASISGNVIGREPDGFVEIGE